MTRSWLGAKEFTLTASMGRTGKLMMREIS